MRQPDIRVTKEATVIISCHYCTEWDIFEVEERYIEGTHTDIKNRLGNFSRYDSSLEQALEEFKDVLFSKGWEYDGCDNLMCPECYAEEQRQLKIQDEGEDKWLG